MLCQNPITIISTFYTIASINSFYLGWACKLNAETGAKKEWRKRNSAKFLTNLLETSCLIADLIVYDRMESENEQNKKHMRTLSSFWGGQKFPIHFHFPIKILRFGNFECASWITIASFPCVGTWSKSITHLFDTGVTLNPKASKRKNAIKPKKSSCR